MFKLVLSVRIIDVTANPYTMLLLPKLSSGCALYAGT
jgi:hypothetical protein